MTEDEKELLLLVASILTWVSGVPRDDRHKLLELVSRIKYNYTKP